MKKMINNITATGRVYEIQVEDYTSKKGVNYTRAVIWLALDEGYTKTIKFEYPALQPTYAKSGKPNKTYERIQDGIKAFVDGEGDGEWLTLTGQISVNEYYNNTTKSFSAAKSVNGSFINTPKVKEYFQSWELDTVITGITEHEEDSEKNRPHYIAIRGYMFDYKNDIYQVSFTATNPRAIAFFMAQEISQEQPMFTKLFGEINQETVTSVFEEETAFGDTIRKERTFTNTRWNIVNARKEPYAYDAGDESDLTAEEFQKALADRDARLETDKAQKEIVEETSEALPFLLD